MLQTSIKILIHVLCIQSFEANVKVVINVTHEHVSVIHIVKFSGVSACRIVAVVIALAAETTWLFIC